MKTKYNSLKMYLISAGGFLMFTCLFG